MDNGELVRYMLQHAKRDFINGVGRLVISDFVKALPDGVNPTVDELVNAWRREYPKIPVRQYSENVVLIELGREGPSATQPFEVELEKGEELVCE